MSSSFWSDLMIWEKRYAIPPLGRERFCKLPTSKTIQIVILSPRSGNGDNGQKADNDIFNVDGSHFTSPCWDIALWKPIWTLSPHSPFVWDMCGTAEAKLMLTGSTPCSEALCAGDCYYYFFFVFNFLGESSSVPSRPDHIPCELNRFFNTLIWVFLGFILQSHICFVVDFIGIIKSVFGLMPQGR